MKILYFFWHKGITILHTEFEAILSKIKDVAAVFVIEQKKILLIQNFIRNFGVSRGKI